MLADNVHLASCSDGKILESFQLSIWFNKICNFTTTRMVWASILRVLGNLTVHWIGCSWAALAFKVCWAREVLGTTQFPPCKGTNSTSSSKINFSIYIMECYLHVSNISLVLKFITFLAIKFQEVKSILSWSDSQNKCHKTENLKRQACIFGFPKIQKCIFPFNQGHSSQHGKRNW